MEYRSQNNLPEENKVSLGELLLSYGITNIEDFTATNLSAVFSALENISNAIGQLPLYITDGMNNEVEHEYKKLFYRNEISKFNLFKQLVWDIYQSGNAFMYIKRAGNGKPKKLIYLKPTQVTINYNENNHVLNYSVSYFEAKGTIQPNDMIHFYKNGIFVGKSTMSFANQTLSLSKETESVASEYFRKGCNVSGLLKMLSPSTDKQRSEVYSSWVNNIGRNRAGIAVMPQNIEYQKIGADANSAQMLETREFNITEIARFFNISPVMLGDLSKVSYSTLEMVMTQFVQVTLQPIVAMIESELTRKLFTDEEDLYFKMDENYLIKFDKKSEGEYYSKMVSNGIYTRNEVRIALGLKPLEGGDSLVIPYTNIQQNIIAEDNNKKTDVNIE